MTQPETSKPIPVSDRETAVPASADAKAAQPDATPAHQEPLTPERVSEWNAYYDLYVMLGVLLLVFVASANKITHSSIWNQLQVGRLIASQGAPVTTDPFSYTEAGKPWVNVPWIFDVSHALFYRLAKDMAPVDTNDPVASSVRADQIGAGALVALCALARLLTALFLMSIRRSGPGLWWSAVCVIVALGAVFSPAGLVLGGVAGPGVVTSGTWGLLFIAVELWLIHRAALLGRRGAAYVLVPLFVVWANVDESFLVGLLVLAACTIGLAFPSRGPRKTARNESTAVPGFKAALGVLAACVLACLLNPSHVTVFPAGAGPLLGLFRPATDVPTLDQLSYFGQGIRQPTQAGDAWTKLLGYYLIIVAIGYLSFLLNRRRFSLSRFLIYTLMVVLWGALIRYGPEFAAVLAVTLALNGQEWYQDRYGVAGRTGVGWWLWSVGGRVVTILAIFAFVFKGLTGLSSNPGEPIFGFGYEPGEFAFEAADVLKTAPITGNVLNTSLMQGDSLVWRAFPARKTFNDSRQHLFPPDLTNQRQEARRALSEDDIDGWKPLFDEYKISVLMLDATTATRTYRVLSQSPNWIPFHDDGNVVLFGRADAAKADVDYFKANRLDPDALAYRRAKPTPSPERPPSPVTWMDSVFRARSLAKPEPHTAAARRWLSSPSSDPNVAALPDPARCHLAIREARTALASRPDDSVAYRMLAGAYRALMIQEMALLGGLALTPENAAAITQVSSRPELLKLRFRERLAALNYAILTTPPPSDEPSRHDLQALNLELAQLLMAASINDLARDRLQAVLDSAQPLDFPADFRTQLSQDLARVNQRVNEIQTQMKDMQADQQLPPLQLAGFAINQGAPGLAIHELEEAERTGITPALVRPQLLDLYCDTGQPDKAVELLSAGTVEDASFGTEPGVSALRQGRAYFLMGNSEYAATLWDRYAIPRLRKDRANRSISAAQGYLRGEPKTATAAILEIPEKITLQTNWEFDSAICRLEGGAPEQAAEHFTKVLTLTPNFTLRPVVAYYLEKLGKPVPPPSTGTAAPAATPVKPAAEPARAANSPKQPTAPSTPATPAPKDASKKANTKK
jgi:tetratricopeptide (TPR) repeat protein